MGGGGVGIPSFIPDLAKTFQQSYNSLIKGEKPQAPGLAAPPALPSPGSSDPDAAKKAQDAQETAAAAERRSRGRASTLLTGASGLSGEAPVSRRMLLGS